MSAFASRILIALAACCAVSVAVADSGRGHDADTVYTLSNAASGNRVLAFKVARNGSLAPSGSHDTGGRGLGRGLGSQGAIAGDGDHIFAVNSGSDDLSVFRVTRAGLQLTDVIASGGVRPISVTVHRGVVYVVNAGSDNIAGFKLRRNGTLDALPGSEKSLSGTGTDPAQIQFSADGDTLIVTEKAVNNLVLFPVDRRGIASDGVVIPSLGQTPFGFALGKGRQIIVSEAGGGAANASSVSSYWLGRNGDLRVLDATDATLATATCWTVVTPDGRFAYVTNTGSDTVTGFRLIGGRLRLLNADGVTATSGDTPIDLVVTQRGDTLQVLNGGSRSISTFKVLHNGQLQPVSELSGLPETVSGLLAL